jgi:hypothetical protein
MCMNRYIQRYGLALLLALLTLASVRGAAVAFPAYPAGPATAPAADAAPLTHGRLSQINWLTTGPNTAQIHVVAGIRRSFYSPPPNIGDSVPYAFINFGDGAHSATSLFIVTYVDVTHDWILAEKNESHTYSGPGPWIADFNDCCRTAPPQHINNPDQSYRVETRVNFAATTASPVGSLPAIVDCPREGICQFQIPAIDPDNQPLRFRFATATEAGDTRFVQPGPPQAPHAATLDPTTGLYTWDTHGATLSATGDTLYSTQVMIEDRNCGSVASKAPLDFFIRLVPTTNAPPFFQPPTPPDGTVFTIQAGGTLTVPVSAADNDAGDLVSLAAINLPAGATFLVPNPGNPVAADFVWMPRAGQIGSYVVNFTATDTPGVTVFTSIRINVTTLGVRTTPFGACITPIPPTAGPTATATTPPPPNVTPTACALAFTDVDSGNPFYPYIRCLACRNIVSGYADGTFRPNNNVTRGQLAKILAQAAGLTDPIAAGQQTFEDVPGGAAPHPFWLWIERLVAHGAISGYACGGPGEPCGLGHRPYFRPGANATRGQIAKIDAVAAQMADPVPSTQQTFTDVPPTHPFWLWIEELSARNIISGYVCGGASEPCDPLSRPYFRPGAATTRGQLSKIAGNTFYPNCQTPAQR